ncbi:hypothetical protein [Streptomyces wuyuanensis]|nr:hypothetical protein [Streptomyces wuyuanensis]
MAWVWAAWYSYRVAAKFMEAAFALSPFHASPSAIFWTLSR